MKLEVGMYVRTKDGISKCIKVTPIRENSFMYQFDREVYEDVYFLTYSELEKYKSSSNIIDLIEVGDYLNGFKVSKIERYDTNTIIKIGNSTFNVLEGEKIYTPSYDNNNGYEKIEKLKSIVTKEQMEQMAYKVGQ